MPPANLGPQETGQDPSPHAAQAEKQKHKGAEEGNMDLKMH